MEDLTIKISSDFSSRLGGRWIKIGPYSGELFYNTLLLPKFTEAYQNNVKLHVYLDGTTGYGSSFLDQSFGELSREFGVSEVKNVIVFHTNYFEWVVKYISSDIWQEK